MRKRLFLILSLIALIATGSFLSGCRPSQQARRSDRTTQQKNAAAQQPSSSKMMDSLLMVQNKLVTVIDTMSDILIDSRRRIRDLEMEVSRLKSMLDRERMSNTGGYNPPPANNYTAPPPTPLAPGSQIPDINADPNGTSTAPPYSPPPAQPSPTDDKYATALKLFNTGKYEEALAAFDQLSHSDSQSPYMPNFLYWRGESLYALKSYNEAIASFHEVLDQYPNSGKSDDAQFKIGSSYEKLGNTTNAKAAYDRLILSYPESEYAARAKTRLQKLK